MRKIVIVDVDGTLTKVGDRIKYLQQEPKNWDEFYEHCDEDKPVESVCSLVNGLDWDYTLYFVTGRRESVKNKTIKWINEFVFGSLTVIGKGLISGRILMRKDGDFRHDTIVKPELLKEASIDLKDIAFVLEDRDSMVKKWREMGLTCLQVADGNF